MAYDPYRIVLVQGRKLDLLTATAFAQLEINLRYKPGTLTLVQGSYSGAVGASAGTHDGGGAIDLTGNDAMAKVRKGRRIGFAIWPRSPAQGPWPAHVHGILIGNKRMSSGARAQVVDYYRGNNGLATHLDDPIPHPDPQLTWHMPDDQRVRQLMKRIGVKL